MLSSQSSSLGLVNSFDTVDHFLLLNPLSLFTWHPGRHTLLALLPHGHSFASPNPSCQNGPGLSPWCWHQSHAHDFRSISLAQTSPLNSSTHHNCLPSVSPSMSKSHLKLSTTNAEPLVFPQTLCSSHLMAASYLELFRLRHLGGTLDTSHSLTLHI